MGSRAPRHLVVSLHDASPLTLAACRRIVADLAALDPRLRASLLVVPDHHGRAPLSAFPDFQQWLRAALAEGHEAVQHGFTHWRARTGGEGLARRLVTEVYTAGEGEFYDLSYGEACERLERGRAELAACGARAAGFIAPAWLLGREAARAVRAAGFCYTVRICRVEKLVRPEWRHSSRSLVWSTRAGWRRLASLAWNELLARATRGNPLLRISIHPPDWDFPAVRAQIRRLVCRALAERTSATYLQWVCEWAP